MADAACAGISIERFWSMTPRELSLELEGASWRAEQAFTSQRRLAHEIARLTSFTKRLPPLGDWLKSGKPKSLEEQTDKWLSWAARHKLVVEPKG